jgi:hypothetical protein
MSGAVATVTRPVRHVTIATGQPWAEFRAAYEEAVPRFDRLEAIGVVLSGAGWEGVRGLSDATAGEGLVNFFEFDPSPVMALKGHTGHGVTYLSGNIVKAEAGFAAGPACFLYIPLRVMIAEGDDGDALISFDHPADLFAAFGDEATAAVGAEFCATLAALLERLGLPAVEGLL